MDDSLIVPAPQRLDAFLVGVVPFQSRAQAQRLIKSGAVQVNGTVVRKQALQLHEGDHVVLSMLKGDMLGDIQDATSPIEPIDLHLPILYEDDTCLVINKPAGFAVHPAPTTKGASTILHGVMFLFVERGMPSPHPSPVGGGQGGGILVHRLDKETTGCLLIAKTPAAYAALQKQFEDRTVRKTYLALVAGVPNPPSAVIDAPVGRKLTDRTKMSVFKTSVSRDARTTYRTREVFKGYALLECDLHTGRTHQIRVHLSAIGHPVLGDATYASPASEKLSKSLGINFLCLHAWKLKFVSPADQKEHSVTASFSDPWNELFHSLMINVPSTQIMGGA